MLMQESWHKTILGSKIPGMFKGSTEHVFTHAIPQLVSIDGLDLPNRLTFDMEVVAARKTPRAQEVEELSPATMWKKGAQ